ncbi:MAG: family 20 glycosylhydrolase [Coriobacteriaceae bacterium]|nr:family 20 glycosylhydrolase [Coriobacteriaceae bacterium]
MQFSNVPSRSWRRSTGLIIAGALALGVTVTPTLSNPPAAMAAEQQSSEELCELVNPVLQSYVPAKSGDAWKFSAESRLVVNATDANLKNERLAEVVDLMNAEFAEKQLIPSFLGMIYAPADVTAAGDIVVDVVPVEQITSETTSPEAYKIEISADGGVRVLGASENAVMYGLRTIEAIMQTNNGELPAGEIVDWPNMKERRLFVDCGRKFFSKDWFIRQIHEMSYLKLNTLDMHFSENLGFRIECDTDPEIVSDEFLTKEEVLEILEEARLYGIKVIPSIDSPGHVDQILKVHPEYGQVAVDGVTHYKSGLDITNPEAIKYMNSIYKEYIDLFKQGGTTTDISIGCDEYMEFDRNPFTSQYRPVLEKWADENLGPEYSWTDTLATYINNLAEFCRDEGLTPRIFNDAIYYGEGRDYAQKVQIHDWIGVDFWSQMSWNWDIANLQDLVNHGMKDIYNFNANYGYFVLRNNDRGASFDFDDSLERWWNSWRPGDFQDAQNQHTLRDDDPRIKGTAIAIWCDYPEVATEDEVMEGISKELRAMASRSWNVDCNANMTLDEFKALYGELGHAGAWDRGEKLPDAGEILPAENVGKVTVHFVDEAGKQLKDDAVKYGTIGKEFTVEAPEIYGYRLVSEDASSTGTFTKEGVEVTFVYELFTNKNDLAQALASAPIASMSIDATFEGMDAAIASARAVFEKEDATQTEVDDALKALNAEVAEAVSLDLYALFVECTYPLQADDYVAGYEAYAEALEGARALLHKEGVTGEEARAALEQIRAAKGGLSKPMGTKPTVSATDGYYPITPGYPYDNMLDGDPNTKCWFNKDQKAGAEVVFTFPQALLMNGVAIDQPDDILDNDVIEGAEVQVSASANGDDWKTIGTMDASKADWSMSFDEQMVRRVRIKLTKTKKNWYQINEVTFASKPVAEDTTLADAIDAAEDVDVTAASAAEVQQLVQALVAAQQALVSGKSDVSGEVEALNATVDAVKHSDGVASSTDALKALYDSVKGLDAKEYEPASWAVFEKALGDAKKILDSAKPQQVDLDAAHCALQRAYYTLVKGEGETPEPQPEVFTVTFDDCLPNTENLQIQVKEGETVNEADVKAPVCEGWKFEGWFTDTNLTKPFDFADPITADMTVFAKWSKVDDGKPEKPEKPDVKPEDPSGKPEKPGKPGETGDGDGSSLPQTGDPAMMAALVATAGSLVAGAGAVARRKREE